MTTSLMAMSAPFRYFVTCTSLSKIQQIDVPPLVSELAKKVAMMSCSSCKRFVGADNLKMTVVRSIGYLSPID